MFDVAAEAYQRFMGRYSEPLAAEFVAALEIAPGHRAVDVGCGPGALTATLVERLGAEAVSAIDPSESFVAAVRERLPGVDVRHGSAESLPFADDLFDVALAQLVVHFMTDPVAGIAEMARVTAPGGLVAASVWDYAGGSAPLSPFWRAVAELDPDADDESGLPGAHEGHLAELFTAAGLRDVVPGRVSVYVPIPSFGSWWEPYTLGVGPAGKYVADADPAFVERIRERCAAALPDGPFDAEASAWTAVGRA